ncbi:MULTISPECIES: helix-turn-helix transcriptional regulator [unclassified Knoellia]|uniref:helix-turn-helix transcriptional regulator n=1 Tax=Knoellia altitudinis TaxID=3404795 RepID=UPI0036196E60
MSQSHPTPTRRLAYIARGAEYAGKSERTIVRWVEKGLLKGFKVGPNKYAVDLNEIDRLIKTHPTIKRQRFGPDAQIIDLSNVVLPVEGVEQ